MFKEKYKKLQLLGQGSFGAAYLVKQRGVEGRLVAKEVRLDNLTEKEREATLAESELLRQVSHPNVVGYFETFLDGTRLHIVMEYADGGDLAAKIRQQREESSTLRESRIMLIAAQLLLALQHIHSRKILHRDLKPMNIFLTKHDEVKLGDFGVARLLESSTVGAETQIGTPLYLAPEVMKQEPYGTKSDLWSLGVVTYELAALEAPFAAVSLPAVAMRILEGEPAPLPEKYSSNMTWFTMGLLIKEPSKRLSIGTLLEAPSVLHYVRVIEAKQLRKNNSRSSSKQSAADVPKQDNRQHQRQDKQEHEQEYEQQQEQQEKQRLRECQEQQRQQQQRLHVQQKQRQMQEEQRQKQQRQQKAREDARQQYFRNRQVALEAKRRSEANGYQCAPADAPRQTEPSAAALPRRASLAAARENAERERLAELERARLAAQEDRRVARERMIARQAGEQEETLRPGQVPMETTPSALSRDRDPRLDSHTPSLANASDRQQGEGTRSSDPNRQAHERQQAEQRRLQELEQARLEALEDRRLALQRKLAREANDELSGQISSTRADSNSPAGSDLTMKELSADNNVTDEEAKDDLESTQLPDNYHASLDEIAQGGSAAEDGGSCEKGEDAKQPAPKQNPLQELERARLQAQKSRRQVAQQDVEHHNEFERNQVNEGLQGNDLAQWTDEQINPDLDTTQKPAHTNDLQESLAAIGVDDLSYSMSTAGVVSPVPTELSSYNREREISYLSGSEAESDDEEWCGAASRLPLSDLRPELHGRIPGYGSRLASGSSGSAGPGVERPGDSNLSIVSGAAERARRESLEWLRSLERMGGDSQERRAPRLAAAEQLSTLHEAEGRGEEEQEKDKALAAAAQRAMQSAVAVAATVETLWNSTTGERQASRRSGDCTSASDVAAQ